MTYVACLIMITAFGPALEDMSVEPRFGSRFDKTHPPVPLLIATKSWLMSSNLYRPRALVLGGGVNTLARQVFDRGK